jgi:hypothetical protein
LEWSGITSELIATAKVAAQFNWFDGLRNRAVANCG